MSILTDLTRDQQHLVVHAHAMGGWLTESYFDPFGDRYSQIVYELVDRFELFRYQANQIGTRGIYRLTGAGVEAAREATS